MFSKDQKTNTIVAVCNTINKEKNQDFIENKLKLLNHTYNLYNTGGQYNSSSIVHRLSDNTGRSLDQ